MQGIAHLVVCLLCLRIDIPYLYGMSVSMVDSALQPFCGCLVHVELSHMSTKVS